MEDDKTASYHDIDIGTFSAKDPESVDYHDYVIKNGVFIGKFEQMYQDCDNPWRQLDHKIVYSFGHTNVIMLIKELERRHGIHSLVEFGCGLGAFSHRISS